MCWLEILGHIWKKTQYRVWMELSIGFKVEVYDRVLEYVVYDSNKKILTKTKKLKKNSFTKKIWKKKLKQKR